MKKYIFTIFIGIIIGFLICSSLKKEVMIEEFLDMNLICNKNFCFEIIEGEKYCFTKKELTYCFRRAFRPYKNDLNL